jgi:hypothetical protein
MRNKTDVAGTTLTRVQRFDFAEVQILTDLISTLAISPGRGKLVKKGFPFSAVKYYLVRGRDRVVQIFPRPNSPPDEGQYV